jgi:O-acetyl-ADP-ribose deacetylase (regulator of RNase III)
VMAFAAGRDPIEAIIERAQTEALQAIERGWKGPPYDPFQLASLLGLAVVPREELADARTVPEGRHGVRIEYNPSRPAGRLRFSVAHEIAHTFFPDVGDAVRHRSAGWVDAGDWQLELLCNIAASELLMPAGELRHLATGPLDLNHLMTLRKTFDVSTEAFLRRVIKLTEQAAVFFAASRTNDTADRSEFRIDYTVPSRAARAAPLRRRLPEDTVLSECVAVGYTAKRRELWPEIGEWLVECVGVPAFPGFRYPRVLGLLVPPKPTTPEVEEIQYVFGDATKPRGDRQRLIVHVVNDRTPNWGGTFARALRGRFPGAQAEFRAWATTGDQGHLMLGSVHDVAVERGLEVVTMVAQHGYGPSSQPRIRYLALRDCLRQLAAIARERRASVHMPRIGSGEAGGDWAVIEELVDQELCRRAVPVTVYTPPGQDVVLSSEPRAQELPL